MSTLRISNIEAKSVPASATVDEKVKITNSSGDTLVFIDGKTSGITTVGINTTDGNIKFDENSNVVVTGIITATRFSGEITPTSLEIGSNIKLGNAGVITATSFVGSGANLTGLPSQVTITGNADNRVITGGSGTNLNGESGLTYDGTVLNISNDIPQLYLTDTNSNNSYGRVRGNGGNLVLSADHNNASALSTIVFESDGSEKVRIDNYGTLRIGNVVTTESTSGNTKRIALGAKASIWGWTSGNINGALTLADNYYWDGSNNKAIENDYSAYMSLRSGSLRFGCTNQTHAAGANVSGGIHEKVRFENDGNVSIFDGNLSFASGHGIDFSSQSTSQQTNSPTVDDEVLQFYEKGKWTPDVRKNNVSNPAASPLHGRYVRIGQMVWLSMYARWASGSNAQGTNGGWQIYGLPFSLQDDNPGTCRIYQFAPAGYFYINGTYYGSARTIRWQCNNSNRLDLYTDLSSSQLAWNSGAMGITFTGCFMIHE